MSQRWVGPLVASLIVFGVGGLLYMNLETPRAVPDPGAPGTSDGPELVDNSNRPRLQEFPIGDSVQQNHLDIAAVWLNAIQMDDLPPSPTPLIHVEADIKATANNPNGFALDEFVPYLKVKYTLEPAAGGSPIGQGEMIPMVAIDGLHYGASMELPPPGSYRLTYHIEPPSAGGLGRHSDRASGVAPWWEPFDAVFEWDVDEKAKAGE